MLQGTRLHNHVPPLATRIRLLLPMTTRTHHEIRLIPGIIRCLLAIPFVLFVKKAKFLGHNNLRGVECSIEMERGIATNDATLPRLWKDEQKAKDSYLEDD